ncbi:MAG: hypothetical protein H8D56_22525 [Planctomycetes bacterium]|nr:hypothetical protein [Planctomycetota bacterium]
MLCRCTDGNGVCAELILTTVCFLVLRAEKTTRKHSQQARDGQLSVGVRILGAVVNDVSRKSRYGYYGYGRCIKKKTSDRKPSAVMERVGTDETSNG